jgi:hypothetical protein
MKRIKIVLLTIVFVWISVETVNYFRYVKAKDDFKTEMSNAVEKYGPPPMYVPGPRYEPLVVQIFYKIFPLFDPVKDGMV